MTIKKINGFTILNEPEPYKLTDYYEVRDSVVDVFKKIPGLLSIYQMGSISAPGISDLDLILVFDDSVENIDYRQYYDKMDRRTRYILMHSPFAITRSLYYNMRYFYVPQNFKLLFGEDQPIKSIPNSNFLYKIVSIEFVLGLLFTVMRTRHTRLVKARSLMNGLYSIKYDLAVFEFTEKKTPSIWRYVQTFEEVRNNWFRYRDHSSLERLVELVIESSDILIDLLELFNKKIEFNFDHRESDLDFKIKLGVNNWVMDGMRVRNKNKEMFFLPLLGFLPFSRHIDDIRWIFTDYIVNLPDRLYFILSSYNHQIRSDVLDNKRYYTYKYLTHSKKLSGFGYLLPPIRSSSIINSMKWRMLLAIRKLLKIIL